MKETAIEIANYIGMVAIAIALAAWLVETVLKERALAAAFISPFACLFVLIAIFETAKKLGWVSP